MSMTVLELYRGNTETWECDVNGHMNVQFYTGKTGAGMAHLRNAIGLTPDVIAATGRIYAAVEARINYLAELHAGDGLHVEARIVDAGDKTMRFVADVIRSADGLLAARQTLTVVSFDLNTRRAVPWADAQRRRIANLMTEAPAAQRPPSTGIAVPALPPGIAYAAPQLSARSAVKAWECDELGHMSVQFYMDRVNDAVAHVLNRFGLGAGMRRDNNLGTAALEYTIRFMRELRAGEVMSIESGLLALGERTFRCGHIMREDVSGAVCATFDSVGICIDMQRRRAVPYPDELRQRAAAMYIAWPPAR